MHSNVRKHICKHIFSGRIYRLVLRKYCRCMHRHSKERTIPPTSQALVWYGKRCKNFIHQNSAHLVQLLSFKEAFVSGRGGSESNRSHGRSTTEREFPVFTVSGLFLRAEIAFSSIFANSWIVEITNNPAMEEPLLQCSKKEGCQLRSLIS